jgi:hypothetical protein
VTNLYRHRSIAVDLSQLCRWQNSFLLGNSSTDETEQFNIVATALEMTND